MVLTFNIISLFPEMFEASLKYGVGGQAVLNKKVQVNLVNPRSYTKDIHQTVDDKPYGGGDGMLMMAQPLSEAIEDLGFKKKLGKVVYLSPQGRPWTDKMAREWSLSAEPITLICGRYAGVDQRFISSCVDEEISLGDFVLSGGELAAQVIMDSCFRFVPGVLGNELSPQLESFAQGKLEGPAFTRPQDYMGLPVPSVLLSGDHAKILQFRQFTALVYTQLRRPDLLAQEELQKIPQACEYLSKMSDLELKSCGLSRQDLDKVQVGSK